jgi:hypothetical protein
VRPPDLICSIWARFDQIPAETFTKGWWHRRSAGAPRQRTVAQMIDHRHLYGAGGNCFDLSVWLHHELTEVGVPARYSGHDFETADAHIAVVAADEDGYEYLCDLGDKWLQPILIDPASSAFDYGWHDGFVPARAVRVERSDNHLTIHYRHASGRTAAQFYDLSPVSNSAIAAACHHSQNLLRRPFCEMMLSHPATKERLRWEYDRGKSFWDMPSGRVYEEPCADASSWVSRIAARTGINPALLTEGFHAYG